MVLISKHITTFYKHGLTLKTEQARIIIYDRTKFFCAFSCIDKLGAFLAGYDRGMTTKTGRA